MILNNKLFKKVPQHQYIMLKQFIENHPYKKHVKNGVEYEYIATELVPINQRKNTGIVSSVSNLVNLCSKLYFYALEDNLLELIQLQEQINDFRGNIFDINADKTKEINGLKYAFLHLYKDIISTTDEEFNFINSKLQYEIEPILQEKIEAAVNYFLNNKQIYQLYPIGKKDLYQFHEIIKIFSKIRSYGWTGKSLRSTG